MVDPETGEEAKWEECLATAEGYGTVQALVWEPPTSFTINAPDGMAAVTISWKDGDWKVEIAPGLSWDAAAKQFWNSVAKMVGQPPPFGW